MILSIDALRSDVDQAIL